VPYALPPPEVVCLTHDESRASARDGRPDSVGFVASARHPLKVHYEDAADAAQAADALGFAELAWDVQVDALGFRAPQLPDGLLGDDGGGPELDIYLASVGAWEGWAEPESWTDTVDGDAYASSPAFVVLDRGLPPEWLGPYVVHEFNHVLQIATDVGEGVLPLWEGVATAAQSWTLGGAGFWDEDVPSYQEAPWAPAITGDSETLWGGWEVGFAYEYGAALWVLHLDEVVGTGDGSVGPALWEAAAQGGDGDEPDGLDAFAALSGEDLGTALSRLARTRWLTGERWDARGLADAQTWGEEMLVPVESELNTGRAGFDLAVHGQAFFLLDASGSDELHVSLQGGSAALAAFSQAGAAPLFDVSQGLNPQLFLDPAGHEQIVLVVSNLGAAGFDGDDDPWVFTRFIIETESGAGCGCATSPAPSRTSALALLLALSLWACSARRAPAPAGPGPCSPSSGARRRASPRWARRAR